MAVRKSVKERLAEHKSGKTSAGNVSTDKTTTGSNTGRTLSTAKSSTRESVRDRLTKHKLEKSIGFDTFESDLASVSDTINSIYGGWQDADTMANTKSTISSMYDRLNNYKTYVNNTSSDDLTDFNKSIDGLISGYQSALKDWDILSSKYGSYKDADSYTSETTKLNELYSMTKDDLAAYLGSDNPIAYTTYSGQDITWQSLYDEQLHKEMATSKEGSDGWNKYLADESAAKETKQKEEEDKSWWEWLGETLGGTSDTTLPGANISQTISDKREDTSYMKPTDEWTDEERNIFGAYYLSDPEKAYEYATNLNNSKNKAKKNEQAQSVTDSATSDFWSGAGHTVGSILTAPMGLADYLNDLTDIAAGRPIVESSVLSPFEYSQTVASGIGSHLNEEYGTIDDSVPIIGGKGLGDVYGLGTSVAQSAASAYALGSVGTLVSYFGQGAAAGVDDALSRGATDEQAALYGGILGAAEGISEHIGADRLLKIGASDTLKELLVNSFKQAGAEGLEEAFSSFAGQVADNFIMQDNSNFEKAVRTYMTNGLSEEEATKKAWIDSFESVAYDALGGFISGGVHAVPQTAMQTVGMHNANSAIGSTIQSNNNADDLRDIASGLNNDAYAKYLELLDNGKISNAKLGNLYGQVAKEVDANYQTEKKNAVMHTIANRANELGDSRNSGVIATAIQKRMNNQSLSTEERNALKSDTAKTIMQEIERGEISVERSGSFKAAYDTKAKVESVLTPKSAETVRVQKRVAEMNTGAETVDNESGQKIEVEGMRKDEDGNTVLQTSEGERLVSDVTLSDHAAEIVAMAEGMDNTKADTFVSLYTEGMDVEEYATSFELAFSYGKNGYGTENVLKNKGVLTEEQAVSAYETGMRSATEAKQKQIEEVTAKHFTGITPGTFDDSGIDYNKVNTQQRAAIRFTELISKATGVNVVYFQSEADADGKWTAENGRYDANTNTIYLDVNAGITESNAKDLIVPTLSHELTHWMKDKAPAAYNKISGIAMDILSADYRYSPDSLVAAEQHRHKRDYGRDVSEEYAQDELVARACEDMLANPEKIEKYISQMDEKTAKTFSERLREAFEKIKEWLADLLDAYKSNSEEAKIVRKYADKVNELQDAWFDAFDNAIKANEAKKKPAAAAEERMAASDRVQYSERNEQDSIANIESRLLEQLQDWLQGKMPAKGYFELGTTPAILQKFGAKELPIIMEQAVVWKFTSDYKDHAIALDEVAKLPSQIAEPVLLFKGSVPNSFVILTELEDKQGREVIAALHLDKVQDRIRVNRVASIYGKDNVAKYVTTQIENGNLLHADKKRSEIWFTSRGLQLPKLVQTLISTSNGSISQTGKNATENSQFSDRAITPLTEEDYSELKEFFGTTTNPKFAGYLLKDGAMLDFSGRHWGNTRPTMREVDHRDVWDVWENMDRDGTDEMVNIIGNGNIRLMPEDGGINLAVKPTAEQTETLKKYIDYFRGKIVVDFDEVGKDTVETYTYDKGTDPQRILDDINNYFRGGYRSELAQFRSQFSDRDSEGTGLTKAQIEFFKNSKLRDENGNLKVMYHGTENASFTVFNPEYSDDGISLFFTDSKTVAKGYSGTMEEYIPGKKYTVEELTEIIHDSYYFVAEEDGQYHIIHNNYGELEREHTTDTLEEMQEYVLEEYGSTVAGNYKVYLNIENPYIMDANNKSWDELAEVNPKTMTQYEYIYATKGEDGTYLVEWLDTNNQYGESETEYDMSMSAIEAKFGSYVANQIASGNSDLSDVVVDKKTHEMIPNNTRQLAEYAKEKGYDGVIINNLVDTAIYAAGSEKFESATVAIAFSSEQVKSVANENPTKDADMRFSDRDSNGTGLTKEQIEYFKDVSPLLKDNQGRLLVLYHQTDADFTEFDTRHKGAGSYDHETPYGVFLKPTSSDIGIKGSKQMPLYALIKNPLRVQSRAELVYRVSQDDTYRKLYEAQKDIDREYHDKFENAKNEFRNYIVEWRKNNPDASRTAIYDDEGFKRVHDNEDNVVEEWEAKSNEVRVEAKERLTEYLKEQGYDGLIIENDAGSFGRSTKTIIAFSPNQVKDIGNLNPTSNPDIRYSDRDSVGNGLTKEQIEYFKDSKVRDEEGNLLVMYHGTPNQGFTVFRKGSYFTNDLEYAELYKAQGTKRTAEKPGVYTVYLNIEKPFDLADSEAQAVYKEFIREGLSTYINPSTPDTEIDVIIAENDLDWNEADDLTEFLQDNGYDYDGIRFKEREGIYSYMTFSENQIKEVSNTTPTEDEDIRYSDRNTESIYDAVGELSRLRKENEKLKKDVERLRQRNKLERSVTGGSVLNENQIDSVAAYLLRKADSAYSKEQLTAELKEIYKYLQSEDVTWDTLMLKATDAASRIVAEKRERIVPNDYAKEILYVLRNTKVSLNEVQKAEAKYAYGKDWYKMYFGRVLVTNDGIPLDSMWQEWSQTYPDVFDADMTDADMATAILDAYDAVKASSELVEAYDRAEMEREIAVEIYNQFWNVSPVRTLADKYERELANVKHEKNKAFYEKKLALAQKYDTAVKQLKYEHRVEMKDMKAKYNQRKTEAVYQTKERYQKTIKELRTKRAEEIRQIKEKSREYNQAYRDRLARKAEIDKITKKALKLNTWLMKNSKEAHVPEILKKPVAAVLKSLNFSSERLLGMRGGEQAGEPTKKDISLSKAFEDLASVVANINDAQVNDKDITEMYGYIDLPADFVDFVRETSVSINDLLRSVGDNEYILNEMSLDQLKDMNKIISTLSHSVTQLDKALAASHGKSIANLAQGTMQYTEEMGKHSRMVGKVTDFFNFDNALPYYAFKMFGEGGQRIFEAFQDGWDKFAFNVKQIMDYSDNSYTGKEVQEWSKEVHEFDIMNGTESVNVRMTTAQIMSLYCLQKREQAKGHLKGGGIRVADFKEGRGTVSQPDGVTLQENDINTIISTLTDRQIKVADRLQEFMNTVCTDWGNDVSMVRFGYKAFGEENYFPITSDANNLPQDDAKEKQNSLFRLLNMSFTKGTIQNANNRVVIDNIFDVFANHTSDMAKYNALALPVLDAFKWYNYKEKIKVNPADKDDKRFKTKSLKQHIEKSYGAGAKSYIVQFLRDINGAESGGITNGEQFAKKMMSHYKTAAVGANLRVAILQPTSYIRASVLLDPKYLTKGLAKKPQIEKAKKTCGIALWKSLGFYDTNISKGVAEQIKHDDSVMDKVKEGSMKLAELGDSMTWGYLYNACEAEVSDKHPGLSGKEKEEAVAKRLREVIYATQVVDSTMTRTQMMRNRSSLNQMLTSFMSEPMVSYNLLHDCYIQYNADKRRTGSKGTALKRNGKKILRASTAYVFTTLVAAAAGSIPDILRDDEEEKTLETYFANVGENALSDVLGMIPLLKDVFSVMQGYSATRMDEQYIASVWSAYKNVMKSVEEGELTYKTFYSIMKAISQVTGIPVSNLMRDVVAIWNSTIGENYESVNLK